MDLRNGGPSGFANRFRVVDGRPSESVPLVPRAKVSPPVVLGLPRGRLLAALRDSRDSRLVVVTAPPGAGKTTLLAQYAHEAGGVSHDMAWCRLDATDVSAAALLRCLAAAITYAREGTVGAADSVPALLSLVDTGHPFSVILDDAHVLPGTEAESELARFLAVLPDGVRLILATRTQQDFLTSSLRLSGAVRDISVDDLRFRSWEVEELFRDHYREPLCPEDTAALTHHTEGWAAGLQMFHLATTGKPAAERSRAVANLWGRSRLLRAYLTASVLATLPEATADFLVRTSALGVLDGTLCDRLLHQRGSHLLLRTLADRHLFIVPCDDEGWRFRYHTVLQTQLENMLHERLGAEASRTWYRRAGALLEEAGDWPEAYRAYARAEDWGAGARVLQLHGVGGADAEACLARVSPALVDGSWLALAEARRHRAAGRLAAAMAAYVRAEREFDDPRMRHICRREHRALAVWAGEPGPAVLGEDWWDCLCAAVRGDSERMARQAAGRQQPEWRLTAGIVALMNDQPHEALRALRAAADGPPTFVSLAARLVTGAIVTAFNLDMDIDVDALAFEAEVAGLPWLARLTRALRAIRRHRDDKELASVLDECTRDGDEWGLLLIGLVDGVTCLQMSPRPSRRLTDAIARARRLGALAVERELRAFHTDPGRVTASRAKTVAHPHVVLCCFGHYSLLVDGREPEWHRLRPRAQATLRLLSLHAGRSVHEETLVEALWPDMPLPAGKHNLQVAISALRKLLEPDRGRGHRSILRRRGDAYLLALPDGSDADVVTFTRSLERWRELRGRAAEAATASLRRAVAAYGGDLLPEDGPAEWVVAERERLRAEAAEAAASLAEVELDEGRAQAAVEAAQRAVRIDPFQDAAWRLQIRAYERLGDVAARERSRRAYLKVLSELGVTAQPAAHAPEPGPWRRSPIPCP